MESRKVEQERVHGLLVDTITLLCKNGLTFSNQLRVQGLLAVTIDDADVFVIQISDYVQSESSQPDNIQSLGLQRDSESTLATQRKQQHMSRSRIDSSNTDRVAPPSQNLEGNDVSCSVNRSLVKQEPDEVTLIDSDNQRVVENQTSTTVRRNIQAAANNFEQCLIPANSSTIHTSSSDTDVDIKSPLGSALASHGRKSAGYIRRLKSHLQRRVLHHGVKAEPLVKYSYDANDRLTDTNGGGGSGSCEGAVMDGRRVGDDVHVQDDDNYNETAGDEEEGESMNWNSSFTGYNQDDVSFVDPNWWITGTSHHGASRRRASDAASTDHSGMNNEMSEGTWDMFCAGGKRRGIDRRNELGRYQCTYGGCSRQFIHETHARRHERNVHGYYRSRRQGLVASQKSSDQLETDTAST